MTAPMLNAAKRVRNPTISSSDPPNSAAITSTVSQDGRPIFANPWMVAEAPYPPHQPSTFWAPCGKKTSASTRRMIVAAGSLSV